MKNKWLKGVSVLLVAGVAIGVNLVGFTKTRQNQQAQRIEQAVTTINSQKKQLDELSQAINAAYFDQTHDLLKPSLTSDNVKKIENNLNRLRVTAEDFSLSAADLPTNVESLSQEKEELQKKVQDLSGKIAIQEKTTDLFTNETLNFQTVTNDVVIKKETTSKKVSEIREKLGLFQSVKWTALIKEYLEYADAQVTRVDELTASFKDMLNEGVITEAATYEQYLIAADSIQQVRNPELKGKFQTQLNQVSEQLGLGMTYTPEAETYEESYE